MRRRPEGLFSTGVAAKIAGTSIRTADYWAKIGLASATVPARGVGSDRLYNFTDMLVLAAITHLQHDTGVPLKRLVAEAIRREPLAGTVAVAIASGSAALVVDLALVRKQVRDGMEGQ